MPGFARTICLLAAGLVAAAGLFCPFTASAWRLDLADHPDMPPYFLAVDKAEQTYLVFERKSPLTLRRQNACTTGQIPGDKLREGDLRTPEGVYFVERRRTWGLDFELYGDLAFTLDYPNPVDRLKGKTGTGIWLHGRGREITPRETRGCVALNQADIHTLDAEVTPGTPVVIAGDFEFTPGAASDDPAPNILRDKVKDWARAWQEKSPDFFSHYDEALFSRAEGRPFAAFRARKERIFDSKPWIQVMVTDVRSLPGPDYWVTWFGQYYRTPDLTSAITKRLYWQKNDHGQWKIVGNAYAEPPADLQERYRERVRRQVLDTVDAWRKAWLAADIDAYASFYADAADQDARHGLSAITDHKRGLWAQSPPAVIHLSGLDVSLHERGAQISFTQLYAGADGYRDKGVKRLVLSPSPQGWEIVSETWTGHKI